MDSSRHQQSSLRSGASSGVGENSRGVGSASLAEVLYLRRIPRLEIPAGCASQGASELLGVEHRPRHVLLDLCSDNVCVGFRLYKQYSVRSSSGTVAISTRRLAARSSSWSAPASSLVFRLWIGASSACRRSVKVSSVSYLTSRSRLVASAAICLSAPRNPVQVVPPGATVPVQQSSAPWPRYMRSQSLQLFRFVSRCCCNSDLSLASETSGSRPFPVEFDQ